LEPVRRQTLQLLVVAAVAAALLGYGIDRASVGTAYSDPFSNLRAQDECTYANSALGLAHAGGWLTPKVLGRYLLFKPPLLLWMAGFCLKIFGQSLWALRLPALVAAICVTLIVFWWTRRERSILVASAAVALFLSNPLMHIFARLCYTDMLAVASIAGAMAFLYSDPRLSRTKPLWGFAASVAAGVMAKNVAGLLPLVMLALYCLLLRFEKRPSLTRMAFVALIAAVMIAPWHIYQFVAHRQWFWADYVKIQLLGYGIQPPGSGSPESQAAFYCKRLAASDPVLGILLLTALPFLILALRGRSQVLPALLTAWFAIAAGALLLFRYQNLPYAILLIPPACLIVAEYNPLFSAQRAKWGLLALCAIFMLKSSAPGKIWGLSFGGVEPPAAVEGLRSYYGLGRTNELILADSDDFFYASTLPLPHIRYYFRVQDDELLKFFPHYAYLGIMLTEDQFERIPQSESIYAQRLRAWGLDSTQPIGTSILGLTDDALVRLVKARSTADYYVTIPELQLLERDESIRRTHTVSELRYGRAFLLAQKTGSRPVARLPARW
jgi:4-amino-4-deoxy-L-arabinose transferase-like glycosyltransferase